MRLGMVLTPPTDQNLTLAAQVGVTDVVGRYQQVDSEEKFAREAARMESFGLRLSVVEGYLPMRAIILGAGDRDAAISEIRDLLQLMKKFGAGTLCYNFMLSDWTRTSFRLPARGGAWTNGFRLEDSADQRLEEEDCRTRAQLWENLNYFLERILPVAEDCGVRFAAHPDDPPLPVLHGSEQILYSPESFDRLLNLSDSPAHGVCFCQANFGLMGADLPAAIRNFGKRIHYIHFRDVEGTPENFTETFHDNGPTDMAEAMRAYEEAGFSGVIRPDHVPLLANEDGDATGYTTNGRLFAAGYIRGLIDAVGGNLLPGK